jgi:hypothetical protein
MKKKKETGGKPSTDKSEVQIPEPVSTPKLVAKTKPGPCCLAAASLVVPIKHKSRDGNYTEELKAQYCAICGREL